MWIISNQRINKIQFKSPAAHCAPWRWLQNNSIVIRARARHLPSLFPQVILSCLCFYHGVCSYVVPWLAEYWITSSATFHEYIGIKQIGNILDSLAGSWWESFIMACRKKTDCCVAAPNQTQNGGGLEVVCLISLEPAFYSAPIWVEGEAIQLHSPDLNQDGEYSGCRLLRILNKNTINHWFKQHKATQNITKRGGVK